MQIDFGEMTSLGTPPIDSHTQMSRLAQSQHKSPPYHGQTAWKNDCSAPAKREEPRGGRMSIGKLLCWSTKSRHVSRGCPAYKQRKKPLGSEIQGVPGVSHSEFRPRPPGAMQALNSVFRSVWRPLTRYFYSGPKSRKRAKLDTSKKSQDFLRKKGNSTVKMAKKRSGRRRRAKGKAKLLSRDVLGNYVANSMPGCHVSHGLEGGGGGQWVLGMEKFHRKEFGLDPSTPVPDLSIDPEDGILTIINPSNTSRAYYITVENDTPLYDRNDRLLSTGRHRLPNSTYINCTTLILTVPPNHTLDVCRIHLPPGGPQAIPIHSDISDLNLIKDSKRTKNEGKQRKAAGVSEVGFPLGGKGPFFCSQGVGGRFTHFYPATHHAIDFECPVGTPVFAIASGTVREIEDTRKAGGIHVSALYAWNSISVELEDGSLVDYVHIRTGSAKVKKGDKVTKGQHICDSGDVGFCPKPHLHLQITLSAQNNSPTTPFHFPNRLLPTAGGWYLPDGRKDHLAPKPEDWETRLEAHRVLSNATLPYSVRETICEMAGLSATASTK